MDNGGYGVYRLLSEKAQYKLARSLLHKENYLYARGVRFFARDILSLSFNQLSLFKALRREDDIKYSHPSLQQLTYQCHYLSINKLSHTYGRSGENMAKYYNDPSLLKPFTAIGTAMSASLVCFKV